MNFNKNDLIDAVLTRYYTSFSLTLDTVDYVPERVNAMILRYITKNLKKAFKRIGVEDKKYQRKLIREFKRNAKNKLEQEYKHEQTAESLPVQVGSAEKSDSGKLQAPSGSTEAECPTANIEQSE